MNFLFFVLFAGVFAGQSLQFRLTSFDANYKQGYLESKGNDVMFNTSGGNMKLVLNSDTTLVDTVSRKYFNIGSNGSIKLSKQPQKGYNVKFRHLAFNDNPGFGKLKNHFVFDRNSNFPESESLGVSVYSSEPVPDVKP